MCLFVGPPYYSQRAVFASPLSTFSLFHQSLFVYLFQQNYAITTRPIFTKFGGNVSRSRKKPSDFGASPIYVSSGLELAYS